MKIQKLTKLSPNQLKRVEKLIRDCKDYEPVTLTPSLTNEMNYSRELPCFYLLTDQGEVFSFLSLFLPDPSYGEAIAFTHPMARRRGFFKRLWDEALNELIDIIEDMELLFVTDGNSPEALAALEAMDGEYQYTEYILEKKTARDSGPIAEDSGLPAMSLQKADVSSQEDFSRVCSLHEEIFYDGQTGTLKFTQEAFRSPDTSTYYIQNKDRCIGLCHLTLSQGSAYLYGFGILPALQNQGYGRAALRLLYASLPEGTDRLWLQVSSLNEPAFSLYTSEGFQVRSKLDYYY